MNGTSVMLWRASQQGERCAGVKFSEFFLILFVIPQRGNYYYYFPLTLHTHSVEEMSEGAATHSTANY